MVLVASASGGSDRLGAGRIAELHGVRLGPDAVLEPVGPVELRGLVVGVDALAEDAVALVERERQRRRDQDDHDHDRGDSELAG